MDRINWRIVAWVVVVVVAGGVTWYLLARGPQTPGGPVPVYAPPGQLVASFPKQLILDNAAAVTNSYSVTHSSSSNQYTAQWNSSSSMDTLYSAYKQYFPANGWTIINDVTQYANARAIYATNASSDVSVSIGSGGKEDGSQVSLTYLSR